MVDQEGRALGGGGQALAEGLAQRLGGLVGVGRLQLGVQRLKAAREAFQEGHAGGGGEAVGGVLEFGEGQTRLADRRGQRRVDLRPELLRELGGKLGQEVLGQQLAAVDELAELLSGLAHGAGGDLIGAGQALGQLLAQFLLADDPFVGDLADRLHRQLLLLLGEVQDGAGLVQA